MAIHAAAAPDKANPRVPGLPKQAAIIGIRRQRRRGGSNLGRAGAAAAGSEPAQRRRVGGAHRAA